MPKNQMPNQITLFAIAAVFIFIVLYAIPLLLAGPSEPIFTIVNEDEHPHDASIEITRPDGSIYVNKTFSLGAGERIKVGRQSLEWNTPPKLTSGMIKPEWDYHFESENHSVSFHAESSWGNTVTYTLTNDSGEFGVDISRFD